MGVSGCGKSTVGARLAAALRLPFADADDWHPAANRAKMAAGRALDDADRAPWLCALNRLLIEHALGHASLEGGAVAANGDAACASDSMASGASGTGSAIGSTSVGLPHGDDRSAGMLEGAALSAAARGSDAHSAATDSSDATLGRGLVLACSALKAAYRDILFCGLVDQPPAAASVADQRYDLPVIDAIQPAGNLISQPAPTARVVILFLRGTAGVIGERMRARTGHFMPPSLLASQFAALEPPVATRSSGNYHMQRAHSQISADDGASQRVSASLAANAAAVIPSGQPRVLVADIDTMTPDEIVQSALEYLNEN